MSKRKHQDDPVDDTTTVRDTPTRGGDPDGPGEDKEAGVAAGGGELEETPPQKDERDAAERFRIENEEEAFEAKAAVLRDMARSYAKTVESVIANTKHKCSTAPAGDHGRRLNEALVLMAAADRAMQDHRKQCL